LETLATTIGESDVAGDPSIVDPDARWRTTRPSRRTVVVTAGLSRASASKAALVNASVGSGSGGTVVVVVVLVVVVLVVVVLDVVVLDVVVVVLVEVEVPVGDVDVVALEASGVVIGAVELADEAADEVGPQAAVSNDVAASAVRRRRSIVRTSTTVPARRAPWVASLHDELGTERGARAAAGVGPGVRRTGDRAVRRPVGPRDPLPGRGGAGDG
jgi:hypothetical protein